MTPTTKQAILSALRREMGEAYDNLYRAESAFRGMSAEDMAQKYGQSDSTRLEIVEGYRKRHAEAKAALAEAEGSL